jgi:hypothetical protein
MSKHTPGPWEYTEHDIGDDAFIVVPCNIVAKNGVFVVDFDGGLYSWEGAKASNDERYANARLIAAAPDLLAACKEALAAIVALDVASQPWGDDVYKRIAAAIAKAEPNPIT